MHLFITANESKQEPRFKELNHQTEIFIEQTYLHREQGLKYFVIYFLDILEVTSILHHSSYLFIAFKYKNGNSYEYSC